MEAPVAGTTAIGGARRPSTDGSSKRAAGRYVLGDLLGRGGMAEVFAGHSLGDHGFQKPVAIKRLLPELASDHVFVERLIEEAKLLVGMQHGNIVSVIDLARDGDDVFLVMEFVDGPSLRQLLKSRGSRGLSLGVATYIVQSAAAGLEFAHNRPGGAIIHADISPSNLLLTTSGEVRVADFGIARREGGGHGVVEGKWAYMAPEQARGEPLTPRSDVFALGVVLYELICGAHPLGRQVTHEERDNEPMRVVPPRVVKPSVPPGLDAICMRALAHDPRDRYRSMQQLIDAIVEERFSNHYREGASDLAQAIRDASPSANAFAANPRTMVTDRPVTLMTRSLLRELTPARRSQPPAPAHATHTPPSYPARTPAATPSYATPAPSYVTPTPTPHSQYSQYSQSDGRSYSHARGSEPELSRSASAYEPSEEVPPIVESGARTSMMLVDDVARAMLEVPPMFRDGSPLPAFRMPEPSIGGASPDLSSVMGGHTMTGHAIAQVASEPERGSRWTIAILALAMLIGIGTAIVFHLKPSASELAPVASAQPDDGKELAAPATQPKPPVAPQPAAAQSDVRPTFTEPAKQEPPAQEPPKQEPAKQEAQTKDEPQPRPEPAPAPQPAAPKPPEAPAPVDTRRAPEAPSGTAVRTAAPAPALTPARAASHKDPGFLRVHTTPWAWAVVGNEKQETPGAKFKLAPGHYTVRLSFPTLGVTETHHVTIESTRTFTLNINKEDE
jgi:serine/threonine protein kinase/outer membrane biosynthesis protein TonB